MRKLSCFWMWGILIAGFLAITPSFSPAWAAAASTKKAWELEWEKVVKEAKNEGTLVIYAADMNPEVRDALTLALKDKFGLKLETITGRGQEIITKMEAERRAGLYMADLYLGGVGAIQSILKPAGHLAPLEPMLFLPEVLNEKAWVGGQLSWVDNDHYNLAFLAIPKVPVSYNKEFIKPADVRSWQDFLNPKWKGKLMFNDPSLTGSGSAVFMALAKGIMDLDYLRQLAKQDLVITRDQRQQAEWLVRGKYPIGIGLEDAVMMQFKKVGAPIGFAIPREGSYMTCGTGALSLLTRNPHPNAAKLFINWLLTKEGQTIFSRAHGNPSARVDVPTDFLPPEVARQPDVKYLDTVSAEYAAQRSKYAKMSKEVFGIK